MGTLLKSQILFNLLLLEHELITEMHDCSINKINHYVFRNLFHRDHSSILGFRKTSRAHLLVKNCQG